jgi:hypothetical protein
MLPAMVVMMLASNAFKPTAVVSGGHLLVADGAGAVRSWSAKDLAPEAQLGGSMSAIASDGSALWGTDGKHAFRWSEPEKAWKQLTGKPAPAGCNAFAVVRGAPVATCGPGVFRFTDGKYWDAPEFHDQIKGRGFGESPQAIAAHDAQLAIGTGFGEWGGYLWLLDTTKGEWTKFYDALAYVNGVAWNGQSWAIAWSMSHMSASTQVRLHSIDAKVALEDKEVRGKYLRAIAVEPSSHAMFAIEQNELVRVDEKLALSKVQDIGTVKYESERMAVGVASGVAAFLAIGDGRWLVVPVSGQPLVVGGGKSAVLVEK